MAWPRARRTMGTGRPPSRIVLQGRAITAVTRAVRTGKLPRISPHTRCVDCGGRATEYDHRDYSTPLVVEAVCHACNLSRGPAQVPVGTPDVNPSDRILVTLNFTPSTHAAVKAAAQAKGQSMTRWIEAALATAAKRQKP